jgi:intracellular sulfur oxidation DsrE/DsrF family protein
MEKIVIEVADATAKKWRNVSPKIKNHLEKSFAKQIDVVLQKVKEHDFEILLKKASEEAANNGLTEEVLQKLLNEK